MDVPKGLASVSIKGIWTHSFSRVVYLYATFIHANNGLKARADTIKWRHASAKTFKLPLGAGALASRQLQRGWGGKAAGRRQRLTSLTVL